jgi:hypothetical protein
VVLNDAAHVHVVRTVCKTWRCEACSSRMAAMYKLRTVYGTSRLENLFITTVTYEMGKREAVDALSASTHLRKLFARLKRRERWKDLAWCRVTELTKRGQVHHHLMIGGVSGIGRCQTSTKSKKKNYKQWYEKDCLLDVLGDECLNHELAKTWHQVTGDSYVVDVDKVRSERGLSSYLAKYLVKSMHHWKELNKLGFKRRWNCSRNFPSPGRLRLAGSDSGADDSIWESVSREPRGLLAREQGLGHRSRRHKEDCEYMAHVGIDMNAEGRKKTEVRKIERMLAVKG